MKNCPFCRAELADEARFCPYCMEELEDKERLPSFSQKKRKKHLIPLICALVGAVAAILLLCLFTGVFKKDDPVSLAAQPSFSGETSVPVKTVPVSETPAVSPSEGPTPETGSAEPLSPSDSSTLPDPAPSNPASNVTDPDTTKTPETETPVHTHAFGVWATVKQPTCTENGTKERVCACGEKENEAIPASGHVPEAIPALSPTCTEAGLTEGSRCSVCLEVLTEQTSIPASGHSYGEWTVTKPATDEAEGTEARICAVCGDAITRTIDKKEHNYTGTVTPPTCTAQGYTSFRCAECGKEYTDDYTPALGHQFGVYSVTTAPTCAGAGTETRTCARCGETESRSVPAAGHVPATETAVAPTCTEAGFTEGSRCSVCGATVSERRILPALGHDEVTDPGTPPTCTEAGLSGGSHCARCGETLSSAVVLPAKGHQPATVKGKPATCTEAGRTDGSRCSVCSLVLVEQTAISPMGHSYTVFKAAVPASCETDGSTDELRCERCGDTVSAEVLPSQGHLFDAGVCTVCGLVPTLSEGLEYKLNSDGASYSVAGLGTFDLEKSGALVIPPVYEGLPVTEIAPYAFNMIRSYRFEYALIPEGVTKIGEYAFAYSLFRTVALPKSLTVVENHAFGDATIERVCYSGTLVDWLKIDLAPAGFPSDGPGWGRLSLGSVDLYACGQPVKDVTVPSSAGSVPARCFDGISVTSVVIEEGVSVIEQGAFARCPELTGIRVPRSVTDVGDFGLYVSRSVTIFYGGTEEEWKAIRFGNHLGAEQNLNVVFTE